MAISTVSDVARLDEGNVLVPERYDPRRRFPEQSSTRLSDIVRLVREQVSAETADPNGQYLVLATGDANNGVVKTTRLPCSGFDIGSAKNRIQPGQVIISRLRPYLRQVAWVDPGLVGPDSGQVELLCSSEFYVLDSGNGESIAYLVPFLLSQRIQDVLAASQEGGHHPRFNDRALKALPIPASLLAIREELSAKVEQAVSMARSGFGQIESSVDIVNTLPSS
jgi:hypothetical protein